MSEPLHQSLNEVFVAQRPRLLAHALALLRDPHQAEDVVQEAYLRAARSAQRSPIEMAAGFLFRTVHNLALDLLRQRQRRQQAAQEMPAAEAPDTAAPAPEQRLMAREPLEALALALNRLPPRAAEALILSRLRGWSHQKIAEELGVAERTVRSDLKTALLDCRSAIERQEK